MKSHMTLVVKSRKVSLETGMLYLDIFKEHELNRETDYANQGQIKEILKLGMHILEETIFKLYSSICFLRMLKKIK